jgi:hypothetical protein
MFYCHDTLAEAETFCGGGADYLNLPSRRSTGTPMRSGGLDGIVGGHSVELGTSRQFAELASHRGGGSRTWWFHFEIFLDE